MTQKYILYPDCIPVKGVSRSSIYDLGRDRLSFIPNSLYDILVENKILSTVDLEKKYSADTDILREYFDFLIENEFVYITNGKALFPSIETSYKTPYLINNMIIDSDQDSSHNYHKILSDIEKIGCQSLLLRFYHNIDFDCLDEILSTFRLSRLRDVQIILSYESYCQFNIRELISRDRRLSTVIVYSSPPKKKTVMYQDVLLQFLCTHIFDETHCGDINARNFQVNIRLFMESKLFNNCLFKKVSIDKRGYIKNCPSFKNHFGNIATRSICDAILEEDFKKLWFIKKDDIEKCKLCEFRYACVDCRVYIENEQNIYSPPAKCTYDINKYKWAKKRKL